MRYFHENILKLINFGLLQHILDYVVQNKFHMFNGVKVLWDN